MILVGILSLALQAIPTPDLSFLDRAPIRVARARVVGESAILGRPSDGALGTDGRACVSDMSNGRIICLSSAGHILWVAGGEGDGPGEFRRLYRIAMTRQNEVLALDLGLNRLTRFDASGRVLMTSHLPVSFRQVISMLVIGGDLLISGTPGGKVVTHGIHLHRFNGRLLELVRSFGPLPRTSQPRLLEHWGTGMLAAGPEGGFIYSLRLPYEFTLYDRQGQVTSVIRPSLELPHSVDEALQVRERQDGSSVHALDVRIAVPAMFYALEPGLLLSNRQVTRDGGLFWDFISGPSGETTSVEVPPETGIGHVFGVDRTRGLIWAFGSDLDGAPLIWRLEFTMR